MTLYKICARCGKNKPVEEFNKRARSRDGFRPSCRECDHEVKAAYRESLKEARKESEALPPGSGQLPGRQVEAGDRGLAPTPVPSSPAPEQLDLEPGARVIGRIGGTPAQPRIREVALDAAEEGEKAAAREYASLLNKKLSVRQRANLMVKIARNVKGPTAALALQALRDINTATGVVSAKGTQVDLGPLFVLPEGVRMKMGEGA